MDGPRGYRRPAPGTQPPHRHPPYVSSLKRAPTQALVHLPHTLTEVTGPTFGPDAVDVKAFALTRQHAGPPLGERIVVGGRVLDEDGRPVSHTLVELWQANAAGRYRHEVDQHDAPLDPNFTGTGQALTDAEGRYRFVTVRPGAYPWRNHANAWRPAHIHVIVSAPGYQSVATHIFDADSKYLASDAVFAVKASLVRTFQRHEPGTEPAPDGVPPGQPWYSLQHDFRLGLA